VSPNIDSILVPTDGSDGAVAGARRGIDLAVTLGASLHVLSVVDTDEAGPPLGLLDADERAEQERLLEAEATGAVEAVAGMARDRLPGDVTTAVERGAPATAVADYARRHGIDLIAMGTRGRSGLERALLGSVAEKTIRTASIPVFAVPRAAGDAARPDEHEHEYDDVLLPTDGSEGAVAAIDLGVALADAYDATVHTVYSVETGRLPATEGVEPLHDALEATGREALSTVRERARAAGVGVSAHLGRGPAARVILSYVEDHGVDLVVMGTHGRSGVERYLVGSVTETVVRHAAVPVCCVPLSGS
jgi:nucleotide-binding universal stress UspA family protein